MIKLGSLLFALLIMLVWWKISAFVSGRGLRRRSHVLKNDQIEGLIRRLALTAGVDRIEVRVLETPTINGLATPQGEIYVTAGLVEAMQRGRISAPEFASVIAHELGHLALGHTKRRMIDMAVAQAVRTVLGGLLARLIPVIGWYLATMLSRMFVAKLSQKDEFEADAYATAVMLRAGLGAEPQARMLEKLETLTPGAKLPKGPIEWLASHPPVEARAAEIRKNAERWDQSV